MEKYNFKCGVFFLRNKAGNEEKEDWWGVIQVGIPQGGENRTRNLFGDRVWSLETFPIFPSQGGHSSTHFSYPRPSQGFTLGMLVE